jgi:hypothetical protein
MVREANLAGVAMTRARSLASAISILSVLVTGCAIGSRDADGAGTIAAQQVTESTASGTRPPSGIAAVTGPAQTVTNVPLDYCFAYPDGFTQITNDGQVEIVGPHSGTIPEPGLVWIDAIDAQGHSARDLADKEVNAFGGSPIRSTLVLGGEDALVLDGMPGQDALRKVYIVHNGLLYTLSFSPDSPDNASANAQMETLFSSVTSSWVWMSSRRPCPTAG